MAMDRPFNTDNGGIYDSAGYRAFEEKTLKTEDIRSAVIFIIVLIVRFISDRMVSHSSFMACADVKGFSEKRYMKKCCV